MIEEKPNLNTGQPWSDLDNRDLEWNMKHKLPVDQIAEFLCRTEREVRDQAKKLASGGYRPPKPGGSAS